MAPSTSCVSWRACRGDGGDYCYRGYCADACSTTCEPLRLGHLQRALDRLRTDTKQYLFSLQIHRYNIKVI